MDRIIKKGRVDRGWLGVNMRRLDPEVAYRLGIDGGVVIAGGLKDSPADRAGLREGDIVVSLNGRRTENVTRLGNAIMLAEPGKPAEVEFYRGAIRMTAKPVMQDCNTSAAIVQGGQRLDKAGLIIVLREL